MFNTRIKIRLSIRQSPVSSSGAEVVYFLHPVTVNHHTAHSTLQNVVCLLKFYISFTVYICLYNIQFKTLFNLSIYQYVFFKAN